MLSLKKLSLARSFYSHVRRFRQIVGVVVKYGFGDIIDLIKINRYLKFGKAVFKKRKKELEVLSRPQRVRLALEELGPTFIKLGQILSTRPDLMPVSYIIELSKLQDEVPEFPFQQAEETIKRETGRNIDDIFDDFDPKPIAAASIGQVYKAKLKNGKDVVIKIRRPGIQKIVDVDLEIIYQFAALAERNIQELEFIKPTNIVDQFSRTIKKEMDYTAEMANIIQFIRQYSDSPGIVIPHPIRDLCTERMLTMEYIEGIKVSNVKMLKDKGYDTPLIARRGADFILKQIFRYGYFHADPHPGNIFILPYNKVCFLDYGMMGRISEKERALFADLLANLADKNEKRVVDAILRLTTHPHNIDRDAIEKDVDEFIDRYLYLPLKEISLKYLLYDLMDILIRNNLYMKPHLYLMMKSLSSMDSVAKELDPDFEIIKYVQPFVKNIIKERYNPKKVGEDLLEYSSDMISILKELPQEIHSIIKQTQEGCIKFEMKHSGLDDMIYTHNMISKRLSVSIVLAALIIGSSLIVLSGIPPRWNDIPIIGLAGMLVSSVIGLGLLLSFLWRKF